MPTQVIDLRTFIKSNVNFDPGYDTHTVIGSQYANVRNINVEDIESQFDVDQPSDHNSAGKYYAVVGFNKVGDGSVFGP